MYFLHLSNQDIGARAITLAFNWVPFQCSKINKYEDHFFQCSLCDTINLLLTKLARSRWRDIGLVLILTGLVPPAPESSIGAFSSSASVLSVPDSTESFPTQIENSDNCMDMDIHDSSSILSNDDNDNGQSAYVYDGNDNGLNDNMNIKQSNDNIRNSNLDPSNDTIDSCTQNDINTSNDEPSNSLASCNKASGSGSRVVRSTGARVKSQVSGSSSPLWGPVLGFSPRRLVVDIFLMLWPLLTSLQFLAKFQVPSVELSSVFFPKSNVRSPSYFNGSFFGLSQC